MKDPGNTFSNFFSAILVSTNIMTIYIILVQRICSFLQTYKSCSKNKLSSSKTNVVCQWSSPFYSFVGIYGSYLNNYELAD